MVKSGCWSSGGGWCGCGCGGGLGAGFGAFDAVLRAADAAFFNTGGVERAADNMVANAGKVFHTATADQNNRMFLEIMTLVRDIGDDLVAVREPDLRNLP